MCLGDFLNFLFIVIMPCITPINKVHTVWCSFAQAGILLYLYFIFVCIIELCALCCFDFFVLMNTTFPTVLLQSTETARFTFGQAWLVLYRKIDRLGPRRERVWIMFPVLYFIYKVFCHFVISFVFFEKKQPWKLEIMLLLILENTSWLIIISRLTSPLDHSGMIWCR